MTLLIVIIVLALIFDYINGFHDAANSIATIVATKVLTPFQAVLWAAFFNFLAYWVFGFGVADTVAKTAKTDSINLTVILAGIIAAIIWNLITWWKGIPSSSSHTLIGGFAGAALAHAISIHGFSDYVDNEGVTKHWYNIVNWYKPGEDGGMPSGVSIIIAFIVLAPLLGLLISYFVSLWLMYSSRKNIWTKVLTVVLMVLFAWFLFWVYEGYDLIDADKRRFVSHFWTVVFHPANIKWTLVGIIFYSLAIFNLVFSSFPTSTAEKILKRMQLLSSAAFSLGHGGNDSQKVMGIIAAAVTVYVSSSGLTTESMPEWLRVDIGNEVMPAWIPFTCYTVIGLGTLSGGWKIVKTMGSKITKVTAFEGVVAESAGALTLFITEHFKIPVSTTHTITGSIIGVGVTKRVSAVRWGVTVKLLWAWVLTIPVSALIAGLTYHFLLLFL